MFPLLFLLSAIVGVLVAIDPAAATGKFILIVLGLALSAVVPRWPARVQNTLFVILPTLVALYYCATNNWAARVGKVPLLDPILNTLATLQPNTNLFTLDTNVVGGVMATYLPLQFAALIEHKKQSSSKNLAFVAGLIGFSIFVLIATASRGAWLAAALVAVACLAWQLAKSHFGPRARLLWMGLMLVGLLVLAVLLAFSALGQRLVDGVLAERGPIWSGSFALAQDYPFTGLGLSGFEEAYSAYSLLTHVPFLYYAHSLFLDIWLGHGALGLLAFTGWVLVAVRNHTASNRWGTPALAALGVILIHGLFDNPWYGYGAYALPLLFVPLGLLTTHKAQHKDLHVNRRRTTDNAAADRRPVLSPASILSRPSLIALAVIAATIILTALIPALRARFVANLGAISQHKTELAGYSYEKFGMQDAVRRDTDLQLAIGYFQSALQLDITNAVAHRRLGQIELARGNVQPACVHFRAAFANAPSNRAARQFMGECAALDGQAQLAADIWQTLDLAQGQIALRYAWYNDFMRDSSHAALISAAAQNLP